MPQGNDNNWFFRVKTNTPTKKKKIKAKMQEARHICFTPPQGIKKPGDLTPSKIFTPKRNNFFQKRCRKILFEEDTQNIQTALNSLVSTDKTLEHPPTTTQEKTLVEVTFWEKNGAPSPQRNTPEKLKTQQVDFRSQQNPVIVTAKTLKHVSSKRVTSQITVMDNVRAEDRYQTFYNAVNQLFSSHDFPKNLTRQAEWLHLIAFTIADGSNQNPQVKDNLVVGSARANINMRGYEGYIKKWIKKELAGELRLWADAEVYLVDDNERVAKTIQVHVAGFDQNGNSCFKTSIDFDALSPLKENKICRHAFNTAAEVLLNSMTFAKN